MSPGKLPTSRSSDVGPRTVLADRRSRRHLRELCDEVLASHRAAAGRELFSAGDRADAYAMVSRIAGGRRARSA